MELGARITLQAFVAGLWDNNLHVPDATRARLTAAREVVKAAAEGNDPVYGLNTGLGANLGHRIAPEDIPAFQHQLIAGRAVAVGPLLPAAVGRAVLLARLIGAARGHSGMSLPVFEHLHSLWSAGLAPGVPQYGSIGASDLTQNASWALAVLGQGPCWSHGQRAEMSTAFSEVGIIPPSLAAKDGMALINHSGLSVAVAGLALNEAQIGLRMMQHAAVMSCQGFGANPLIFSKELNALRTSPQQAEMAAWFAAELGAEAAASRVQDALSFRTIAPVFGAAQDALLRATRIWEDELNGASDNPAVLAGDAMCSTPNFHAPALGLALEQISLAMAMVANSAVMRVQRMMDPRLSGLPKYLSPIGGASAGFVPLQKTAAALVAEVHRHAMPAVFDAAPVSDGVEDMAPMTPMVAHKLSDQMKPLHLIAGVEAVVAAQARDLRGVPETDLHQALRRRVVALNEDRPLGRDVDAATEILRAHVNAATV